MEQAQELERERKERLERSRSGRKQADISHKGEHRYRRNFNAQQPKEEGDEYPDEGSLSTVSISALFVGLFFAILKDLLDLVGLGSLPVIGTTVTILVSIIIAFMMLLAGAGNRRKIAKRAARRFGVLILGSAVEAFVPGVNFLPIETITVIVIIIMMKAEQKGIFKIFKKVRENGPTKTSKALKKVH